MRERLTSLPVLVSGAALIAAASIFGCNPNRNNTDLYRNQSSGTAGQNTGSPDNQQPGVQPSGGPAASSTSQAPASGSR